MGSAKFDDDDDGDDVRIGSMEEGSVGGKEVHILSLEWNGAGLICSTGEFKLSSQYQGSHRSFFNRKVTIKFLF